MTDAQKTPVSDEVLDEVERALDLLMQSARAPHTDDTYRKTFALHDKVAAAALARLREERRK